MVKQKNITFNLWKLTGGALSDDEVEGEDLLANMFRPREPLLKDLPQFGNTTLKIPPFFAVPTKKGWKLANPLTEIRNLSQRQHKLSLMVKRSNVKKPEIDMSVPRRIPTIDQFSSGDQSKLRAYLEAVKDGKEEQYLFKNKPRGFPAVLYKNAKKAGLKETKEKVYTKNKLKAKPAPSKVPQGRPKKPRRRLRIEGDSDEEGDTPSINIENEDLVAEQKEARDKRKTAQNIDIEKEVGWDKFLEEILDSLKYKRGSQYEIRKMVNSLKELRKEANTEDKKKINSLISQAEKINKPENLPPAFKAKYDKYLNDDKLREEVMGKSQDFGVKLEDKSITGKDRSKLLNEVSKYIDEVKAKRDADADIKQMTQGFYDSLKKNYNKAVREYKESKGTGFRKLKCKEEEIEGGSLLGDIGKKAYKLLVKPKVDSVKKNIHRITHPKETIQEVKDFGRHLVYGRHDAYPPSVKKIIEANATAKVLDIDLHRRALPSIYTKIMSFATGGETEKRIAEQPKDTLFHISMWVKLDNGKTILVEKNEVINMKVNPTKAKEEEVQQVPNPPAGLIFGEMLEKTREAVGDKKFFSYSAKDNNCGNFIEYILKTNGMNSQGTNDFIGQDAKAILKGFPSLRKFMNTLTDTAGRANVLLEGGDIEGKGFGMNIARRIYDWWKPPFTFEEWREREKSRFETDAEAEHALEQAKADRKIATAEKALNKLKADTEAHKIKLAEIREAKLRLAKEYGVWLGDADNYINYDEAREHTERVQMDTEDSRSKRREENEKIEEEDEEYDTGRGLARFNINNVSRKNKISHYTNIMPTQGGRMLGLSRPAVLQAHIGHPALMSDQYPRIPQAFTQVHLSHPVPIGRGLYAGAGLGGSLLDDIYGGSRRMLGVGMKCDNDSDSDCEGGKINIGRAFSKAFDPKKNGVAKAVNKTFTPQLGRDITSGLIHKALPAVISGVASSGTTALTGNPALGFAVGQTAGKYAGKKAGDELGKATGYGLGGKVHRGCGVKGRMVKGSQEAKDYMASIRRKKGSKGGAIPAPPSRSPITDPSLL